MVFSLLCREHLHYYFSHTPRGTKNKINWTEASEPPLTYKSLNRRVQSSVNPHSYAIANKLPFRCVSSFGDMQPRSLEYIIFARRRHVIYIRRSSYNLLVSTSHESTLLLVYFLSPDGSGGWLRCLSASLSSSMTKSASR